MRNWLPLATSVLLAASAASQQAADSGLGFLDAQAAISAHLGADHDGLLGLAVDGIGHYWVSVRRRTPGDPHRIIELDAAGNVLGAFAAPAETSGSSFGLRDGAYDPSTNCIFWGIDPAGAPQANVYCFDLSTRQFTAQNAIRAAVVTGTIRGLAFDGTGFWAGSFASPITSFSRAGVQLSAVPSPSDALYGLAWHPVRGTLWAATQAGLGDGLTQGGAYSPGVHVIEVDPATGTPTGDGFRADYLLPAGTTGVAGGCEIWRRGSNFVISILVQGAPHDGIVELIVDADVGVGCGGLTVDYTGGNAWAGNPNFAVVARGVAAASGCAMLIGFDTATVAVPGVTLCPVLGSPILSFTVPNLGGSHVLSLPVPATAPAIGIAFQAAELGAALPVTLSQVLWVKIVP